MGGTIWYRRPYRTPKERRSCRNCKHYSRGICLVITKKHGPKHYIASHDSAKMCMYFNNKWGKKTQKKDKQKRKYKKVIEEKYVYKCPECGYQRMEDKKIDLADRKPCGPCWMKRNKVETMKFYRSVKHKKNRRK